MSFEELKADFFHTRYFDVVLSTKAQKWLNLVGTQPSENSCNEEERVMGLGVPRDIHGLAQITSLILGCLHGSVS